jgi:transcriptional regulator with XRE-family HTH domain
MEKDSRTQRDSDTDTDGVIRIIAMRFAEIRKKRGLTQSQLGELAGVAQSRIFELEQGTSNLTVRTLVRMAKLLEVDPRDLFPDTMSVRDSRFAEALLRLTKAIEERTTYDKALMDEIGPILDMGRLLAGRRLEEGERRTKESSSVPDTSVPVRSGDVESCGRGDQGGQKRQSVRRQGDAAAHDQSLPGSRREPPKALRKP